MLRRNLRPGRVAATATTDDVTNGTTENVPSTLDTTKQKEHYTNAAPPY